LPTVNVGGRQCEVQRFTLTKALRAITLLNVIQGLVPDGAQQLGEFIAEYRRTHVEELDRVQAKLQFGGEIPVIDEGKPVLKADGTLLTIPAPIEQLTEKDWERAGHVFRRREDPPTSALVAAVFPTIADRAEEPLLRLLAICIIPNDDFSRYARDGTWEEKADGVVHEILEPAYLEDVIELTVIIGEVLEGSVLAKLSEVADRSGKLLTRLGIRLPSRETPELSLVPDDSSTSGSTLSPDDTAGDPTTSGTSPGTSPADSPSNGTSSETSESSSTRRQEAPA
jgi:hypothetical protein